jgi:dipeptidyl aminopeptidase/acylaminoacyl peptidase
MPENTVDTSSRWQDRFTRPRLFATEVAPAARTAGLVTMVDGPQVRLYAWDVPSGGLRPVDTAGTYPVSYRWLGHDGTLAYVLVDDDGNELGHLTAVDLRGDAPPVDLTPTLGPYTVRGVGISRSGAGMVLTAVDADGFHLYHLPDPTRPTAAPRPLARYPDEAWTCLLSADGDIATVDITAHNPGVRRFAVRALRVADGAVLGTFADTGQAGEQPGSVEARLFSPRPGDPTVCVTTDAPGVCRPVLWHAVDDTRRALAVDHLPGDVIPTDWSDDGRHLLLAHTWRAAQQLLRYDLDTDRCEVLDVPPGTYHEDRLRTSQFGPDGTVLAGVESLREPLAVHRHRPGAGTEALLTSDAPPGHPTRSVDITSSDGVETQGWLAIPAGAGPHPAVIIVHGGPHVADVDYYDPVTAMWVDHGYACLRLNYRGSTSFGRAYREAVWGDVGHWEIEDIVAARQWLVDQGIAAPDRVLLSGGSYGGFLTLYALGVLPHLWAGGIAEVALADWRLAYQDANPALQAAMRGWFGGTPDDLPHLYRERSPLTHLPQLAAPLLIRQARYDTRTPRGQMEVYEQEAQRLGKPVTVLWDTGGHGFGDRLAYYRRALDFAAACLADDRLRAPSQG